MRILSVENIKRIYDSNCVLDVESFHLDKGERVALVGPNGSGKSTLMNIISLLDTPSAGEMEISGNKVNFKNPDEHRSNITMVSQEPFFFAGSLQKNMEFGLIGSGLNRKKIEQVINEYLELVGIAHLANRTPRTFSSGEKKRAAFARALVRKTPIVVFDEPFANVDSQSITILESVLNNLSDSQTVLFSTHELARAYDLSDRIVTLQAGKVSPWTPENLYKVEVIPVEDGTALTHETGMKFYYPYKFEDAVQVTMSIDPSQVLLSNENIESSAQNSFSGTVKKIEQIGTNRLCVTIESKTGFSIRANVTNRAMKNIGFGVSDEAWVHFKSSAIHVFNS